MDQDVKGNGFFSSYQTTDVTNLTWSNQAHGSGSYDYESKLDSRNGAKYDSKSDVYTTTSDRGVTFLESADFSYAPAGMQMGKYSFPIDFQSKGAEKTCLKNYISGVSMNARFNYLDTLSKNLSSELYWKLANTTDEFESNLESNTRTKLNFEAAFSGSGHVGALDISRDLHDANILIDEDYRGTYYITKNMSHDTKYNLKRQTDDWLPCCSGGFADMNLLDKKPFKSATGVFDCTCFKAPTKAQFPRIY
ncbi:MAG: hypothetical protein NTU95_02515 [Methanothrix sp.]|nr:hypothetical protein [Methanothrix sp.]